MNRTLHISLVVVFLLINLVVLVILIRYIWIGHAPENTATTFAQDLPALGLAVQAQNANSTFNTVGQSINYVYVVTNNGSAALSGPVTIADDKMAVNCPNVNTAGNQNDNLDNAESLTCTSAYTITQADLTAGFVTNTAVATAGGVSSNSVTTTMQVTLAKVLELTGLANPTTYNQAGQMSTFTYSIKNTGTATLGPAQFVINDDHLGVINCGGPASTLTTNQAITCTAIYATTQNDLAVNALTFTASATGGGVANIQPLSITVTNTSAPGNSPSNIVRGSTIKHQVNDGEWLDLIARCYGADSMAVRSTNPQIANPYAILHPDTILTVPDIGSAGDIYGPPCLGKPIPIPVSTAEAIYSAFALQDAFNQIDRQFQDSVKANLVFTKPESMKLGETVPIDLLLNPSMSKEALATLIVNQSDFATSAAEPGQLVTAQGANVTVVSGEAQITNLMRAELKSAELGAFDIELKSPSADQPISSIVTTKWHWSVTAKREGTKALELIISRLIKQNDREYWVEVESYTASIVVQVTPLQRLLPLDWKWITTVLLIPIAKILYDAIKRRNSSPDNKVADQQAIAGKKGSPKPLRKPKK